ncbi:MAG: hypothetical protein JWM82_4254 [Myxococcales bacterium]|nr:hypothetical protein [Myxococcales bacterium]
MFFPLILSLLPLVADPVALNGKVMAEARAGESPSFVGQESQLYVSSLLVPQVELRLRDRRVDFRLAYLPQLVWQFAPAPPSPARPLILHRAGLSAIGRPTATTNLGVQGFGAVGQPDYFALPQLIGPGQAALPPVDKILMASATAAFTKELSLRWRLTLTANVSHFEPYGNIAPTVGTEPGLLRQTTVGGAAGVGVHLTPIDDLSSAVAVSDAQYANGIEFLLVTPRVTWLRRRPAGDDFQLTLGVSYARDLGSVPALVGGPTFLPTGSLSINWHPMRYEGYAMSVGFTSTVEQYVDPVLRVAGPRALVAGQVQLVIVPSWIIGAYGAFFFSLRQTPLTNDPDETTFALNVPVRRRFSKNVTMELGGRWSERGPAFASPNFAFRERQLLAYLQLTVTTEDIMPYGSH